MVVNVTLSPQLLDFAKRLERELDKAHEASGRAMVGELRDQIHKTHTLASLSFLRSITKQFEQSGAAKIWKAGSALKYAEWANRGRGAGPAAGHTGPGIPPMEPILRWMAFKGITPHDPKMTDPELAFIIARSIGKKGWAGRYPFTKAMVFAPGLIETAFNTALGPLQAEIQ